MRTKPARIFITLAPLVSLLLILLLGMPQAAAAKKLFVTNNAFDSGTCGTKVEPCRSISRAIDNAGDGDHILVGPGRYGDLNSDGDFNDPGEEAAEVGFGCRCMILVNKRLVLKSTDGPVATVLDANSAGIDIVNITMDKAVFGGRDKGFTLTGARMTGDDDGIGLSVLADHQVDVVGNIAFDNQDSGFAFSGNRHRVKKNIAIGNGGGFIFAFTEQGHIVINNIASANGNEEVFGSGFSLFGNNYFVVFNTSTANKGMGFLINSNQGAKFQFRRNTVIGNRGAGIWVFDGPNLGLNKNNIFGNLGETVFFQSEAPNCGLVNDSGDTIDATSNYWGAASGPGPDPADDAGPGSICDRNGITIVEPFARRPK